jgi:G8 domain
MHKSIPQFRIKVKLATMKMYLENYSLILLSFIFHVNAASLSNATSNENDVFVHASRQMQVDGMKDFKPLTCNAALASAPCTPWTERFGMANSYTTRVVIPCGECVTMDLPNESLTLSAGLDIIGKLVFPDGFRLKLSSPVIAIQGELEMTATKTVDGNPDIMITMIGDNEKFFTPVDINAKSCNGAVTCTVGKKGIVVAGGKVNIHGLPPNTPAWTRLFGVVGPSNNPDTIYVPNSVLGKWGVGAEILITPHTRVWNENQVRIIKSVSLSDRFAKIQLDSPILRPTTVSESGDFAVEVALLSRNIVFEGGSDKTARHGGHFMIMHTPTVIQTIDGVDLQNFGQQGNLGRYPIHFHFCDDVDGSVVSRNTIRQSNQRCVVVHGTNKLRIEENVAFDTKGHCYMTEDGMETNNEFIRNLGAQTGIPAKIIPNQGSNGDETDFEPATFWITNPTNSWVGNVAAGSEHSGYWFEPKLRGVRASAFSGLNPQYEPLILFKDNVAHSNTAGRLVSSSFLRCICIIAIYNYSPLTALFTFNWKGCNTHVYARLFSVGDDSVQRIEGVSKRRSRYLHPPMSKHQS